MKTATLFHYLPASTQLILVGDLDASIRRFTADTRQRYNFLSLDRDRPILEPQRLFLSDEDFFTLAKPFARLVVPSAGGGAWSVPLPTLAVDRHAEDPAYALRRFLDSTSYRVLLVAESAGRRETILQWLHDNQLKPASCESFEDFSTAGAPFTLGVAALANGFALPEEQLAIVTENELYGSFARRSSRRRQEQASNVDSMVRDLSELKIGDPVVHSQHGIGRYHGLITMDFGEGETELLHLEYAGESKLYVPVAQLHVISRYSGADPDTAARLHTLGSGQWDKAKRRAAQQIRDTAAELLNLYARRAARQGHAFELHATRLRSLCRKLRLRRNARSGRRDPSRDRRHDQRQADGPIGLRRCRFRQDRGSVARGVYRRDGRQAGGNLVAHHAARRAAFQYVFRSLLRLAGAHRRTVAL